MTTLSSLPSATLTSATSIDLLHPDNVAGQTLLSLVARGSAIITEMLRLSDHIPPALYDPNSKYVRILVDFRYLKGPELYDSRIDNDTDLTDIDEEFREGHYTILERFYQLFESIYRYIHDFSIFYDELHDGVFVQYTIESVLEDLDGGQLLCECLYQFGVMLLIMDRRLPGDIREKIIISYYRYKGAASITNLNEVVRLCKSTGLSRNSKRPLNYPEEFFLRSIDGIPIEFIELLITRLRQTDIYNHTSAYPAPAHRSIAYSAQSALIYVLLYFVPDILHKKENIMREIIDKHFPDNWVIAYYMGSSVDLADAWAPYKAATAALKNTLSKANVEEQTTKHANALMKLNGELAKLLDEGVLTEDLVLENPRQLVQLVRECNFTLRWLLLHRTTMNKKFRELIVGATNVNDVMRLLLHASQFEFQLKSIIKKLLDSKHDRWDYCKKETTDRLNELSSFFSGEKELTRVKKSQPLQDWFKNLSSEVQSLDFSNSILVGRKINTLITALGEVQEFHQIDASLQVKQFLADCREFLTTMVRTVNITNKVLGDLDIITEFAYAWEIINDYTPLMHERIRKAPQSCLLLRASFLKLASILNTPLVRITACNSNDDISVAEYFSSQLVLYVRQVLEVIPQNVFKVLDEIIAILTNRLKPFPTKLERKYLNDYAQLQERNVLAKHTHQISVFANGILSMSTTLYGIIKLDPRQLLEDGIRKELVKQTASALHEFLTFRTGKIEEFEARIGELGRKLDGFRQSFEYIQDYVGIYGLKIWQEEVSRIIHYNVEQECNSFLRQKIHDWQSVYQSDAIPIPTFPPIFPASKQGVQVVSVNFMGRLMRELLFQTDVRNVTYVECLQGWYDRFDTTGKEVIGIRTFNLLHRSVGIFGLTGLDQLISFHIVHELSDFIKHFRRVMKSSVDGVCVQMENILTPVTQLIPNASQLYPQWLTKTSKVLPTFLEFVSRIGSAQLIRRQIANELNFSCKLESKILCHSLEAMNRALINSVQSHYAFPDTKPYPANTTLSSVTTYVETAGISNPLTKIYITTESMDHFPVVMFLFILSVLPSLQWNAARSTLECKQKNVLLDGAPLIVGIITLFQQFHSVHLHTFLGLLGQYVRAYMNETMNAATKGTPIIPAEVVQVLLFLEEFCKFGHISRNAVDAMMPSYIFDRFARPS